MKDTVDHNDINHDQFFEKVELPFDKSKEALWDSFEKRMEEIPEKNSTKVLSLTWLKVSAAAMVIVLLGTTFFFKYHTTEILCPKGERLTHILPDGSVVDLNADSRLAYNPYWWKMKREVRFSGEAFFNIEKGKRFAILSEQGMTEILGTSFNIFARKYDYKVFCKTGKVKVSSAKASQEFIVTPGEIAIIDNYNRKGSIASYKANKVLAWQNSAFNFTSETLQHVVFELERQYDVEINIKGKNLKQLVYTGYFKKGTSVESSLNYICKSFNLDYIKNKKGHYELTAINP